ncbi:MAG TPA: type II CAAX endopeptidase family protein [Pyrinomonadaceae bacterium]|nr:type II CAAX endopeptidase family protein [Pyrinomonadaceae bacterium]
MNLKTVFFNEFGRLRSGVRFMIFLISFFVATFFLLAAAVSVALALPIGFTPDSIGVFVLQSVVSFAVAVFFGWLYGKIFEDLPFRALGLWFTKNWLKDLVLGLLIGAFSLTLAVFIAVAVGGLSFKYNDSAGSAAMILTLGVSLFVFILGAAFEEAFFRGYLLQTLSRARLAWVAIALTSIFFASAHLGNKSANIISTINTALAGIWLGLAYLKTRNLWFPFGIHLMWNWFQGAIFGVEVSGLTQFTTAPVLREIDAGPAWLTGESYGLEGGIACTIALVISMALIYFLPILKPTEEMLALTSEENPVEVRSEK